MSTPDRNAWDRYWFGEASLVRLGAFRIAMFATALYAVLKFKSLVLGSVAAGARWRPLFAFELLGVEPPSVAVARAGYALLVISLALGIVGLCTRAAAAAVAVLAFLWIATAYSFNQPHHDCIALMFGLLALPFSPSGARLSLDSVIARWRRAGARLDPRDAPVSARRAALPVRVTQVTVATGYFFAAATKLAIAGPGWANGYTLQGILTSYQAPWSDVFARSVILCAFLSIGTLVVQGAFPLALVWKRSRWFFVPAAVAFHLATWKTMSTGTFLTLWLPVIAAFVPLDRVPAVLRASLREGAALRRSIAALAWTGGAALVLVLYLRHFPELWIPGAAGASALLAWAALTIRPEATRVELRFDPGSTRQRRVAALVASLNWAGRIRIREASAARRELAVVGPGGELAAGRAALREVVRRVPLLLPLALFLPRRA